MKTAPIKRIEIDAKGHLQVYPDVAVSGDLEFIYRDASGVTWDQSNKALVAREPDRWKPETLFKQIVVAAIREYGIKLEITPSTTYSNVSDSLKTSITQPWPIDVTHLRSQRGHYPE